MSRTENAKKNALWQSMAVLLTMALGLVSRYVFNRIMGREFLGLNSLFVSILGVLNFADMGISNSFTYCLYKPIAENNEKYLAVLLNMFRRVMFGIMGVVLVIGLGLAPFLRLLASGADRVTDGQLYFYYGLSLLEVLVSYFGMYRSCYVAALQEEYRLIPIQMWGSVLQIVVRIITVIVTRNYTAYIVSGVAILVLQILITQLYIIKKYPIVQIRVKGDITKEDKAAIARNVKAAFIHRFANFSINQTDSLIISAVLNISTLGSITNYTTLKDYAFRIISRIQNAAIPGMGNVVATETKEKQLDIFYRYLMVSQILVSGAICGLSVLMTPVIVFLFGEDWQVSTVTISLMMLATMVVYYVYALNILPNTHGRNDIVAPVALVEGVTNLVVSLVAVRFLGLTGVYVGTVASEVIYYILEPQVIFRKLYDRKPTVFYSRTLRSILLTVAQVALLYWFRAWLLAPGLNFFRLAVLCVVTGLVYCAGILLMWGRDKYFKELLAIGLNSLRRRKKA